jgi:cytochrome c oxidase subunit 2
MVMFAWGFKGSLDMTNVPEAASRNLYKATAKQWNWTFTYPNGQQSFGEVWVEVDKPVAFATESTDVLHAFYLPQMRVKRDVIPGRSQVVWFEPKEVGDYHLFCAEYCGNDHSKMYAQLHVVSAEEFAQKSAARSRPSPSTTPTSSSRSRRRWPRSSPRSRTTAAACPRSTTSKTARSPA